MSLQRYNFWYDKRPQLLILGWCRARAGREEGVLCQKKGRVSQLDLTNSPNQQQRRVIEINEGHKLQG